jgi:hypothetical protein
MSTRQTLRRAHFRLSPSPPFTPKQGDFAVGIGRLHCGGCLVGKIDQPGSIINAQLDLHWRAFIFGLDRQRTDF